MSISSALFVSKRLQRIVAALILLASVQLAVAAVAEPAPATSVVVAIRR